MGGWVSKTKQDELVIEFPPTGKKPMLNDVGIDETLSELGMVTEIQGFSYYKDEERILLLTKDLHISLAKFYRINMERFELTPTKASLLIKILTDLYEANMRRSIGGRSLNIIGGSEKVVVTKDDNKGGWRFPWGKKG